VAAAATTSLPEEIGGERNWDYRYVWLRDASVMLAALSAVGYAEEARRFAEWLLRTTSGRAEDLQIMYGIGGERLLHEIQLHHLDGYRGSRPVRIGNGAWDQFQLDVYGELLFAVWFALRRYGGLKLQGAAFLREVVEMTIRRWQQPDEGIWETRGGRQHFVFSKLMAWLTLDCGIRLLELVEDPARNGTDRQRWEQVRDQIRSRIEAEGVDPATGVFVQAFDSKALDAAALQIGLRGFLPFADPRVRATVDRIAAELTRNGHVYRYLGDDGLAGGEGSFIFCTLWLVSALAYTGRLDEAEKHLAQVLDCANDLGLLAEEIAPDTGEQLGNFPQGFSHLGLIMAVLNLEHARAGASAPPELELRQGMGHTTG
jgi:alpha,alpha-trehalase